MPCYHQNSKGNVKHILFQQSGIKRNNPKKSLPPTIQRTHMWANTETIQVPLNRLPTQKRSKFHNYFLDKASKTPFQANLTRYEPKHEVTLVLKL